MKSHLLMAALLLTCVAGAEAATVDTLQVHSARMNRDIPVVVIVPDKMEASEPCPVIYLLHGYSKEAPVMGHKAWLTQSKPELPQIADERGVMFVCPNGSTSWYWDSPINPDMQYETFVCKELISYIDTHYPTLATRGNRAITGLSMGGQGALWSAIHHPDVFGLAGSTSGGVDIRQFPTNWDMMKNIGSKEENPERWEAYALVNQIDRFKAADLKLIIDCGYDDFFFAVNNDLHDRLLKARVPHDYIVRPGAHTHPYWNNSIDFQIEYFCKNFTGKE